MTNISRLKPHARPPDFALVTMTHEHVRYSLTDKGEVVITPLTGARGTLTLSADEARKLSEFLELVRAQMEAGQ